MELEPPAQDGQKAVQRGRSERRGESYALPYVEPLSDAGTKPTMTQVQRLRRTQARGSKGSSGFERVMDRLSGFMAMEPTK